MVVIILIKFFPLPLDCTHFLFIYILNSYHSAQNKEGA